MSRPKYLYRVVTHNAAGVHSHEFRSLPKAQQACREIAARDHEVLKRIGATDEFEIERVQEIRRGSHRYWMRRRKRWVLWDPHQDAGVRQPDFMIRAGAAVDELELAEAVSGSWGTSG